MSNVEFLLGKIEGRLDAIDKRLEDGSAKHAGMDKRIGKLESVEARRGGVIAAVAALASIVSAVLVAFVSAALRKIF